MQDNRYYGEFGGQYVSESLMNTLNELEKAFDEAIKDPQFIKEYMYYLKEYVGRETPLYYAERISEKYGAKTYILDSTALQQLQEQHFLEWNVQYIWVLKI